MYKDYDDFKSVMPLSDLGENDRYWIARVELPGVKTKNLSVRVEHNIIFLRAKATRKLLFEDKLDDKDDDIYWLKPGDDRGLKWYERKYFLPTYVSGDKISAKMHHGILEMLIEKPDHFKVSRVHVSLLDEKSLTRKEERKEGEDIEDIRYKGRDKHSTGRDTTQEGVHKSKKKAKAEEDIDDRDRINNNKKRTSKEEEKPTSSRGSLERSPKSTSKRDSREKDIKGKGEDEEELKHNERKKAATS